MSFAPKILTVAELFEEAEIEKKEIQQECEKYWHFDKQFLTLTHVKKNYEVDLERCRSASECLDWMMHLMEKSWCDPTTMFAFIKYLDLLLSCQSTFRGSQCIDVRKVIEESKIKEVPRA